MWGSYRLFLGVLLLAGMLAGAGAYGQGGATGAISGVVVDTSGGSISGADVQVIDARTESVVRKLPTGTEEISVRRLWPRGITSSLSTRPDLRRRKPRTSKCASRKLRALRSH